MSSTFTHRRRRRPLTRLLLLFLAVFLALPGQGRAFSVQDEKDLGEKLLSLVRSRFTVLDEPDLAQYVDGLGREILAQAGPLYFDYHFFVVADRDFNAFAAPSGLVFVNSGLIDATRSEDELFSVLAHECAHVRHRHIARRMETNKKISLGTAALLIAGAAMGNSALGEALITGSMAAGESMNLHFSRKDEEEADRQAFSWMAACGRDPAPMLTMLKKMQRLAQYRGGTAPPYLLTHPLPQQRLEYIADLLAMYGGKQPRQPRSDFAYQRFKARVFALTNDPARQRTRARLLADSRPEWGAYGLALATAAAGDTAAALQHLATVRRAYPKEPLLLADQARILFQANDLAGAEGLLAEARRLDPDDLYLTWIEARLREEQGQRQEAEALYEKLAAALPDNAELANRLGRLKAANGRHGQAMYFLGRYQWLSGDGAKARTSLETAIRELGDDPLAARAKELLATIDRVEDKF